MQKIEIVTDQVELALPCHKVTDVEASLPRILDALNWVEDEENHALGLAAPQIGVKEKWFVMKNTHAKWTDHNVIVVINPKMAAYGKSKLMRESCFSAPGEVYEIDRKLMIETTFLTLSSKHNGVEKVSVKFAGHPAQVFQHEFDHIKGKCIFHKGQKVG